MLAYIKKSLYLCTRKDLKSGHGIPEEVIRRRFKRGIDNLLHLYLPICDSVLIYNNIKTPAQLIVRKKSRREKVEVVEDVMWNLLIQKYE